MSVSCVKDVDFNQASGFTITPVFRSAFTYFTATPAKFFDASGTIPITTITDKGTIDFFQEQLVQESLVQMDFLVEASNAFTRDFTITIELLNSADVAVYTLTPFQISASQTDFTATEVIDFTANPQVFSTTQVQITAQIQDTGVALDPNDTSEFVFKSAMVFYVRRSF